MKLHPDKCKETNSEAAFKCIADAHQCLIDVEKKKGFFTNVEGFSFHFHDSFFIEYDLSLQRGGGGGVETHRTSESGEDIAHTNPIPSFIRGWPKFSIFIFLLLLLFFVFSSLYVSSWIFFLPFRLPRYYRMLRFKLRHRNLPTENPNDELGGLHPDDIYQGYDGRFYMDTESGDTLDVTDLIEELWREYQKSSNIRGTRGPASGFFNRGRSKSANTNVGGHPRETRSWSEKNMRNFEKEGRGTFDGATKKKK